MQTTADPRTPAVTHRTSPPLPAPAPATAPAAPRLATVIFSKDRPLQLEATLRSFSRHCRDAAAASPTVLFRTTSDEAREAYRRLAAALPGVAFLEERDFKAQLEALLAAADAALLLVDDNVFVRPFALGEVLAAMAADPEALGFSLRLGRNTTHCHPLDRDQRLPAFAPAGAGALAFAWPAAELDFGYPLEVSSSVYWTRDLLPLLRELPYRHPNSLEEGLAARAERFRAARPRLLCYDRSVAFCVPANRVQETHPNRTGSDPGLAAAALLRRFLDGDRIEIEAFDGFTPVGCHQEVPLRFVAARPEAAAPAPAASPAPGPRARGEGAARAAAGAGERLTAIVFSKDRPLQLQAAAASLRATCTDPARLRIRALVYASTDDMARRYGQVGRELPFLELVPEVDFKETTLQLAGDAPWLAFVVDDALFVRPWSVGAAVDALRHIPLALGVSLRLGRNTTSCYALDRPQGVPPAAEAGPWLAYDWTRAEHDFGYPLELSSSIYRAEDLLPLLRELDYRNPNELEAQLAACAPRFAEARPALLMAPTSVAFCAPVNVVQTTFENRAGRRPEYDVEALGRLYDAGGRVDVAALRDFVPGACHQEIELPMAGAAAPAAPVAQAAPAPDRRAAADPRPTLPRAPADPADSLRLLAAAGAWREGTPLRLHLGCGERRLEGYVNVDLPGSAASIMATRADVFGDVPELRFPPGSVDELRSHHVFEHFPRVEALALLIRWSEWLRPGGRLVIETPDLEGSARTLLSDQPLGVKLGVVRHLAGDQAEGWAFHVDHWFPERFRHTLAELGFGRIEIEQRSWPHPPFLSDVVVVAEKGADLPRAALLERADGLLAQSTVAAAERPTLDRWRAQLRTRLDGGPLYPPAASGAPAPAAPPPARPSASDWIAARPAAAPRDEVVDFNQRERDRWVAGRAATVPPGARVLDVGAGTCPYRPRFAHCRYVTHDFKQYEGVKLGGGTDYGRIDLVSRIEAIPAPDASFDVVLCTEVLEHVPSPDAAVREMARLLAPGGRLLLTAPLGSGLHQLPFHYFGGFSPEWYREQARRCGLEIVSITPNGGFFKLLAQETARAAELLAGAGPALRPPPEVLALLGTHLPTWFHALDQPLFVDQFTVGYFVEARRPGAAPVEA